MPAPVWSMETARRERSTPSSTFVCGLISDDSVSLTGGRVPSAASSAGVGSGPQPATSATRARVRDRTGDDRTLRRENADGAWGVRIWTLLGMGDGSGG